MRSNDGIFTCRLLEFPADGPRGGLDGTMSSVQRTGPAGPVGMMIASLIGAGCIFGQSLLLPSFFFLFALPFVRCSRVELLVDYVERLNQFDIGNVLLIEPEWK